MRPRHLCAVCLGLAVLVVMGCGSSSEPSNDNASEPAVTRRPADQPQPPRDQPQQPKPPKDQPEPPSPKDVPRDVRYIAPEPGIITEYLGGALGTLRRAKVMIALDSAHKWLTVYHLDNNRYPENMAAFVKTYEREGGRLDRAPVHYKYFYWPKQGQLRVVRLTDKRFDDPTGLHTLQREP